MLPTIKGFTPSSLIDWEGKLSCILFLPGCNFRCRYCHAADLVLRPDELADVDPEVMRAYFKDNQGWIDGAVICGGEPTLHEGLPELCEWLRRLDLAVKLDTNGSRPEVVEQLIDTGLIDRVAMDVKAPFDERYQTVVGVKCDVEAVRRTADLLIESGFDHEFRTTVCPAVIDSRDVLDIARALKGAQSYVLQPFRPVDCIDPAMETVEPMPLPALRKLAEACSQFVRRCTVRGERT